MQLPERFEDWIAIHRLNDDFSHELDRGTPEGFADLFVEDAIYTNGPRHARGRAAILQFAKSRTASGPRTSRHVLSGLRVTFASADRAIGVSCCTTFSAPASPPIPSTLPTVVADLRCLPQAGRALAFRRTPHRADLRPDSYNLDRGSYDSWAIEKWLI